MKAHDLLKIIVKTDILLKKGPIPFSYLRDGVIVHSNIVKRLDEHLFIDENKVVHLFVSEDISIPKVLERTLVSKKMA